MKINNTFKLIIAIVVSELAGIIGSIFTTPSIAGWYAGIVKPALNPPAWVFGPVWTTLFALMGIAAFLIWEKRIGSQGCKNRSRYISRPAGAQHTLVNYLFRFA